MTVVRPNSIAGINSITVQTGQALNIHDASGNLIRNITSSTGISTFQSLEITKGTGDLTVGVSTFFVDNSATNVGVGTNVPYNNAGTNVHIHSANTTSEIRFTNSTTGGGNNGGTIQQGGTTLYVSNSESGNIVFENNGSERLRITSAGKIGINETSPEEQLHITDTSAPAIQLEATSGGPYKSLIKMGGNDLEIRGSSGQMEFYTGNADGDSSTERMRIRNDGRISIASSLAVTGVCTAASFVPTEGQLGNRNLIINGAMTIAQRGTSSTSNGYQSVDRFNAGSGGHDEAATYSQHALTSSDTGPWEKGFRYSYHITNGNQTGGAGAGDYMEIYQYIEDQNISESGWNYASSSSYLTISFWVKSSVAQKFYGFLYTNQAAAGDCKMYSFEISNGGSNLSANTWTKITHKIDGDSSLTFNNDNTNGLAVGIFPFNGTNYTTSDQNLNTWASWNSASKVPDMTSTWWTTNDATFEITGVQLEVGSVATPFEHRSYGEEMARCQRYFYRHAWGAIASNSVNDSITDNGTMYNATSVFMSIPLPVQMRSAPTLGDANSTNYYLIYANNASGNSDTFGLDGVTSKNILTINGTTSSLMSGAGALVRTNHADAYIDAIAEL